LIVVAEPPWSLYRLQQEEQMQADEMLVWVQREWNGWQTAAVRLADLRDIHWFQPPRAPRPLLHGYVSCASLTSGEIPHDCERSESPHTLLVCVLKSHQLPSVFTEMARRAGPQPIPVPAGQPHRDWDPSHRMGLNH
jgi:hypothetical protein